MIKFAYTAKNKNDSSGKTLKGEVEASNERQAYLILKKKNLSPVTISPAREKFLSQISLKFLKKISLGEVSNFTRNLSTMMTAGLPLTDSLLILKNQSSSKMAPVIDDVLSIVEGGGSLSEALSRHQDVFTKVYIALVKAGESAGIMDQVMSRLADNLEKEKEFKSKVQGAMIYPVIILIGMSLVGMVMIIFVIPKMMAMYKEFGSKLPAPTRILIALSDFLTKNMVFLILFIVGGIYFFRIFQKTSVGKKKLDQLKISLPLVGNLQKQVALTEISRALGLLIGSGIQIIEALNIVADASSNSVFEEGMKAAAKQVEKGFPLSTALADNENFPPIMAQLLSVGEETGKVDEVLLKISHFFESESDQLIKGLTTAIEPLIMIVLGVGVGFLIVAIILPIYNLTTQF